LGKAQYSINKGLWGTSVGGKETLTSNQPLPNDAPTVTKKEGEESDLTLKRRIGGD
jgi:argininosuccinate synthase